MGGIIIIPIGLIIGIYTNLNSGINKELMAISFLSTGFMLIGYLDDFLSFKLKENRGLTAKGKIILQSIVAISFLYIIYLYKLIDLKVLLFGINAIIFHSKGFSPPIGLRN